MFFSNQFADRNFAAEKFLAFSHLVGGVAMLGCWRSPNAFWPFFGLMLMHCLLYVPTISITNSIAFANMKDAAKGVRPRAHGRHASAGFWRRGRSRSFWWIGKSPCSQSTRVESTGSARCSRAGLTGEALQGGDPLDLHRGRHRLAGSGGVQPDAAAHAAQEKRGRGAESLAWLEAHQAAASIRLCSCSGS